MKIIQMQHELYTLSEERTTPKWKMFREGITVQRKGMSLELYRGQAVTAHVQVTQVSRTSTTSLELYC
jgi:hypothetical protein